jgi:hypothetical protein
MSGIATEREVPAVPVERPGVMGKLESESVGRYRPTPSAHVGRAFPPDAVRPAPVRSRPAVRPNRPGPPPGRAGPKRTRNLI